VGREWGEKVVGVEGRERGSLNDFWRVLGGEVWQNGGLRRGGILLKKEY
jgi:hypothetical protein